MPIAGAARVQRTPWLRSSSFFDYECPYCPRGTRRWPTQLPVLRLGFLRTIPSSARLPAANLAPEAAPKGDPASFDQRVLFMTTWLTTPIWKNLAKD